MKDIQEPTITKQIDVLASQVAEAFKFQHLQYSLFSEEGLAVLDKTMPEVWDQIQRALFYASFSSIGRLCDKDKVCGSKNLTIAVVARQLDQTGALNKRIEEVLSSSLETRKKLMTGRHKIASHPDFEHLVGEKNYVYFPDEIDEVLGSIAKAVDLLYEANGLPPYPWIHAKSIQAHDLLETLKAGQGVYGEIY